MAKKGDGGERSDSRRLSELIYLRTDCVEKEKFKKTAERNNFSNLSSWAMDRLRCDRGMSLRERRVLSGRLAQLMAPLRKLERDGGAASLDILRNLNRSIDAEIIAIQKHIMKGDSDACEGDPES